MELLIPVLLIEIAIVMFILFFVFEWALDNREGALFCLVFSTIFFFIAAACFLGVTQVNSYPSYNSTGAIVDIVTEEVALDYNVFAILSAVLGFLPIIILYQEAFRDFGDDE